ncbi:Gfo/Idh/MocA family protein [Ectobacillus ponti]|uniref:Gfo/Idh/MocA family oxidoreductase n=1 Tax=Ectobacillus ponti TaxID=2961894 RepID=A0AA41X5P8_9BACI|nr:Gfo/Idh/MocA family oxidoreductase [Ectobacillus ponti]MCP8969411.1 Gfo/Idh/MocA family oxidoreductase [Ectobacillus ponti]
MIRFGTIGTNWITDAFLQAAREVPGFALAAVYSRSRETAEAFAAKHEAALVFTDMESMAASKEIDAVYIASPNSLHAEQAVLFMKHGKHVLCEKPLASNEAEARLMTEAAKENGVLLMEAVKSTLLPAFGLIRENLHKIGPVRRYFASYCQYSSRYDAYKQGTILNAFNPAFSNGALMDIGVYCLYPLVVLFGKPDTVKASGLVLQSGVDGEGSMVMQYPEMDAVVMYSKITDSALPSEIQGENGSIRIDRIHTPEKVELRYRNGEVEDLTSLLQRPAMYYETAEFIRLIQMGERESAVNSHQASLITVGIMDEARKQMGIVYPADRKR